VSPREDGVSTGVRYLLFQLPGAAIVAALLSVAIARGWLDFAMAVGAFGMWVLKDALLYPFLRNAYERDVESYPAKLVGRTGRAREDLAPDGYVSVAGELWRAKVRDGAIHAGQSVVVCGTDDGRVVVRAGQGEDTDRST
jgi:membrane protein implicated in regulation of membrane protease activity